VEDDAVVLPFARVPLPREVCERIGGNKLLLAGIRPEHFEDAALIDASERARGVTFRAHVDVTEWLGNELYAYIPFEAPAEVTDRLKSLARELDSESLRTQLIVSLDTASRIEQGNDAELWLDASRMHLFDPGSGENLTREVLHAVRT
jgi:multiple sugar transport system ATP-binding protein